MYYSLFPSKDNVITDVKIFGSSKTGSNAGRSEVLEVFALTGSASNRGKSRILLQFDLNSLSSSISSGEIPSSSVEYRLRLKNSYHHEERPYSFTLEIAPLSRSWDEGRGLALFDEERKDAGVSNWVNATSLVSWSQEGGDYISSSALVVTQSFDSGEEDLNVDVSSIVYDWLTGSQNNYGFLIKLLDAHETGSSDVFNTKFYGRSALVAERRPRLEALWEDVIQDDRKDMNYEVSGSLYYYRFIDGQSQAISGDVFVDIVNSSSAVVQTLTASSPSLGVYQASGVVVSFTASTDIWRDVWHNDTEQFFTGTFVPSFATGSGYLNYDDLNVSITNLKEEYVQGQKVKLNVFARPKDYLPAIKRSGSTEVYPTLLKNSFYEIVNHQTNEVLVSFSTGSLKYSKISYDENGNYFDLWASSLPENSFYRIKIYATYNGQTFIWDKGWTFKVVK